VGLAFCITPENLKATEMTRGALIGVQLTGVAACFAWAVGISFVLCKVMNAVSPLPRVY
jgi:ammonia channel protein AmtB